MENHSKSKLTILTDILMLIILFFTFMCSIIANKYTLLLKLSFLETFQNQYTNPITKIDISRWRCKSNYNYLFDFSYPGNLYGCYDYNTSELLLNITNKEECVGSKRAFIEGIDNTPMSAWRSKVICVKREDYTNISYITRQKDNCPEGYKFCGFYNVFNDNFCVINDYKCPIFYFDIKRNNETKIDYANYLQLSDKYELVYSYNTSNQYINSSYVKVDFRIGEDFPCITKNRFSYKYQLFPFLNNKEKFGCFENKTVDHSKIINNADKTSDDGNKISDNFNKTTEIIYEIYENDIIYNKKDNKNIEYENYLDKRYEVIDSSYKRFDFNEANDLKFLNDLPTIDDWKNNSTATLKLYSRPYISPNFTCLGDNYKKFFEMKEHLDKLKKLNFTLICLLLGNLFSLCFFITILTLMKITSINQNLMMSILKNIHSCLFCFFIYWYIQSIYEKDQEFKMNYFYFLNIQCFDKTTEFAIENVNGFKEILNIRRINLNVIIYSGLPYCICLFIQILNLAYKTSIRIRNRGRNSVMGVIIENIDNLNSGLNK